MPRRAALVQLAAGACWLAAGGVAQASSGPAVPSELAGELAEARLQGSARLTWFGLRVYDARLWVGPEFDPARYAEQRFALALHYLRALNGPAIAERSLEEMRRVGSVDATQGQRWLDAMRQTFPDVRDGDRIVGLHRPGEAARFFYNGEPRGQVGDGEFARLFFGIWLSSRTSQPEMRVSLLGLGDTRAAR
jgi:hypothetical protein